MDILRLFDHHMASRIALQPTERLVPLEKGLWMIVDIRGHLDRKIYRRGAFEVPVSEVFKKLVKAGHVVFDIGAHIGYYTLIAAAHVGETGQVHSFEPVPDLFDALVRNVRLNCLPTAHVSRAAAWKERASIAFFMAKRFHGAVSSVVKTELCEDTPVSIEAISLDDYVREMKIERLDVVKLDVEGAELFVLQGLERSLANGAPEVICEMGEPLFNQLGYDTHTLVSYMRSLGYQVFRLKNPGEPFPYAYFSRQPKLSLPEWS
jgi:FkbM family methyltransferase